MTNKIVETKTVDEENFEFLLAQSDYKLNAVFRSKNPQVNIYPNTPMVASHSDIQTGIIDVSTGKVIADIPEPTAKDTTKSGTFSFDINHTTNALIDLKDFYFDVNAFVYAYYDKAISVEVEPKNINQMRWSTQPLLSLFDHYDLYIDDVLIERSNFGSLSANARYALEYPHSITDEKAFQVNGWALSDYVKMGSPLTGSEYTIASAEIIPNNTIKGVIIQGNNNEPNNKKGYLAYANITQKIKLSDLFSCINTLPPLFNHSVRVLLSRANSNLIGCDTRKSELKMKLDAFDQFKLCGCTYIITDQLKNACEKYYSKKIETLFTSRTEIINTIPSIPSGNSELSFVINTNLAYKNKCLVLAIPRANNPTGLKQPITPIIATKGVYTSKPDISTGLSYSEFGKCYNDYTFGGLAQIDITTANGLKLAHFQMDRDGTTQDAQMWADQEMQGFNMTENPIKNVIYNYLEVYEQYKKCREHFNQLPDEAIDYVSFLKSYCIYCVDLSPFDITANEQIRITMKCGAWSGTYQPFYFYNSTEPTGFDVYNGSTAILVNLYADKILRLLPGGRCEIAQLFSEPESNTINNSVQNVNETQ